MRLQVWIIAEVEKVPGPNPGAALFYFAPDDDVSQLGIVPTTSPNLCHPSAFLISRMLCSLVDSKGSVIVRSILVPLSVFSIMFFHLSLFRQSSARAFLAANSFEILSSQLSRGFPFFFVLVVVLVVAVISFLTHLDSG